MPDTTPRDEALRIAREYISRSHAITEHDADARNAETLAQALIEADTAVDTARAERDSLRAERSKWIAAYEDVERRRGLALQELSRQYEQLRAELAAAQAERDRAHEAQDALARLHETDIATLTAERDEAIKDREAAQSARKMMLRIYTLVTDEERTALELTAERERALAQRDEARREVERMREERDELQRIADANFASYERALALIPKEPNDDEAGR